jgi:type VII secretion integral membrane protein EccD
LSDTTVAGLCRLTIRAPENRFELAVPADVPLADLMPTVVGYAGADLDEEGLEHGGWVLQRLGGAPLDQEGTSDSLGLRDGETLHLRPGRDALPPIHFDDLVDGVAAGLRERGDTWRPELTRRLLLSLMSTALLVGCVVLAAPGAHLTRLVAAAATALLLFAGAATASRAVGDAGAGTVLGAAAVPYLALAGSLVPSGGDGPTLLGARLLAGCAAGAGAAVLGLALVADSAPFFLGVATAAVLGGIGGAVVLFGVPFAHAAGVLAVVTVLLGAFIPALAFRLSGLRLPLLPADAEQLQEDIEPYPSEGVVARSGIGDEYMTGLYMASGVVGLVCDVTLVYSSGWAVYLLAGALSLLLLIHGRAVGSVWQRLAVMVPGAVGAALLVLRLFSLAPAGRILLLVGLLVLATVLAIASWTIPGRRLLPYWGRLADLLHLILAISLLPLALLVLGVYQALRGMNG